VVSHPIYPVLLGFAADVLHRTARIGGSPLNSAHRAKVMRRAALKAKAVISAATIWFRCRVSPTSMR
jgi:hypothetical protein